MRELGDDAPIDIVPGDHKKQRRDLGHVRTELSARRHEVLDVGTFQQGAHARRHRPVVAFDDRQDRRPRR